MTYVHVKKEEEEKELKYIKRPKQKKKNCLTFLVIKATNISPHKKDHTRFEWQSGDNVKKRHFQKILRSESRSVFVQCTSVILMIIDKFDGKKTPLSK